MNTETKKTLIQATEFLINPDYKDGHLAKFTTDNDLYGTTVYKKDGMLVHADTGQLIPVSATLLNSRLKLVERHVELGLEDFLSAYDAGKTVRIVYNGNKRDLNKSELSELKKQASSNFLVNVLLEEKDIDYHVSMNELLHGKFYLITN